MKPTIFILDHPCILDAVVSSIALGAAAIAAGQPREAARLPSTELGARPGGGTGRTVGDRRPDHDLGRHWHWKNISSPSWPSLV